MEQTPYWMWAKQNPSTNTNLGHHHHHHHQLRASGSTNIPMAYTSHEDPSWEEQAFAEDATGAFGGGGGCVWPPRSYSCSFCRREFRSAQALGGHMNVHRRDRARLKQSSSSSSPNNHQSQLQDHQNHHLGSFDHHQYNNPPPVCALVYHQQPNPNNLDHHHHHHDDHDHGGGGGHVLASSSSWPPRVCDHHVQEHHKIIRSSPSVASPSPTTTWANFVVGRSHNNNITTSEYPKPHLNCVKTDLSVSLSLVLHQTHDHDHEEELEEAMRSCKKRKSRNDDDHDDDDSSLFPIFVKQKIDQTLDDHDRRCEAEEGLDLELRLGDRPDHKVK